MGASLVEQIERFLRRGSGADIGKTGFAKTRFNHFAAKLQVIDDDDGKVFFAQGLGMLVLFRPSIEEISNYG